MRTEEEAKEILAAAMHSAWYAYAVLALGEPGTPWGPAPKWQKDSIRDAVDFLNVEYATFSKADSLEEIVGKLAPLSHENWLEYKRNDGWSYGKVKDPVRKTHPCMVPYDDLPFDQREKDEVIIHAYLALRPLV